MVSLSFLIGYFWGMLEWNFVYELWVLLNEILIF